MPRSTNICTWIIFAVTMCMAVSSMVVNLFIVFICLDEFLKPDSRCEFSVHGNDNLQRFADGIATLEPILSAIVVLIAVLLYYECRVVKGCCRHFKLNNFKDCCGFLLCKHLWVKTRTLLLCVICLYNFTISLSDKLDSPGENAALRYAILPLGLTAWYILLLVSNEKGPLASIYPKHRIYQYLATTLFLFASITNLAEFITDTIYLSLKLYSIFETSGNHSNLTHVMDVLGMTAKVFLRLDFAKFFWNMTHVSTIYEEVEYRGIYKDPWEDWKVRSTVDTPKFPEEFVLVDPTNLVV
ncbi:uncharacterized protein LOC144449434 [Glandiceps talaboti]